MSLLFVQIEDAERQLRALRETGVCDPEHTQPLVEWLKAREENEDLLKAGRLAEAFDEYDPKLCQRSVVYAARTLREALEALAAGTERDIEIFDFALGVLSRWSNIQCAHA